MISKGRAPMTDPIRDYFEGRAPTWNKMMPDHLDEALRRLVFPFAEVFRAAQALLEIGTGTGALIPHLLNLAPGTRLVSVDLAHGMLLQARERCPDTSLIEADVHRLPFATGRTSVFDVVVCHNSFPHFADQPRALQEIRRVLRPDGQLFILHNNSRERVNAIHLQAGGPIGHDRLPLGEDLRRMLLDAGYSNAWIDDTEEHYLSRAWCR
jgi:ubiquinone/menaquinone biosynthesis C-methylase UbiE